MLLSIRIMLGCGIENEEGVLGETEDIYFDDKAWKARYFVIDSKNRLRDNRIVIPKAYIQQPELNDQRHVLSTALTTNQLKNSPPIRSELPLSRQDEIALSDHYGLEQEIRLSEGRSDAMAPEVKKSDPTQVSDWDPYLKSIKAVTGFDILANDGQIGRLEDFIVDTETWAISNMVVDATEYLVPVRKIQVSPAWIIKMDGLSRCIHLDQTKKGAQNFPDFDATAPVNRKYDSTLYDYYGRLNQLI